MACDYHASRLPCLAPARMLGTLILYLAFGICRGKDGEEPVHPFLRETMVDIATSKAGEEAIKPRKQVSQEDIDEMLGKGPDDSLDEVPADPVPADLLEPALVKDVSPNDLVCSGCLWAARIIRTAIGDKFRNASASGAKVKDRDTRRQLALELMKAEGQDDVCAHRRFPPVLVLGDRQKASNCLPNRLCRIVDLYDARRKAVGSGAGFAPQGLEEMLKSRDVALNECTRICDAAKRGLADAITDEIVKWKGKKVHYAITDRWLCMEKMNACREEDMRMGQPGITQEGDDAKEENEEL